MPSIALEVFGELLVRRIVGIIRRHGIILILAQRFGGNDVSSFEYGTVPRIITENPVAAYFLSGFENGYLKPLIQQILGSSNAGGAGTDYANTGLHEVRFALK